MLAFVAGHLIWNWLPYVAIFHLLLGVAYAFHVSLTWQALQTRQSDITEHGYLFSAVIIFLGNISVLLLGVPLLAGRVGLLATLESWWKSTEAVIFWLARLH